MPFLIGGVVFLAFLGVLLLIYAYILKIATKIVTQDEVSLSGAFITAVIMWIVGAFFQYGLGSIGIDTWIITAPAGIAVNGLVIMAMFRLQFLQSVLIALVMWCIYFLMAIVLALVIGVFFVAANAQIL